MHALMNSLMTHTSECASHSSCACLHEEHNTKASQAHFRNKKTISMLDDEGIQVNVSKTLHAPGSLQLPTVSTR